MSIKISDYTEQNGLVFCNNIDSAKNNAEILYISEVKKLKASAVFFRRFYRNEMDIVPYNSEPAVCIFEEKDIPFKSSEHTKLHASLWSAGRNEIYIIRGNSRIDVINARKPCSVDEEKKPFIDDDLILASTALKNYEEELFSAHLFGSGTFWEQTEFSNKLDDTSSPYIFLLKYLMDVRGKLLNAVDFKSYPSTIDKLLITSLLVKFLEEKGSDEIGKHTLQEIYNKFEISSFVEAIEKNRSVAVFEELANEFNGRIFDKFSTDEKKIIQKADLSLLAKFLRANIDIRTNQLFIWELYDFKYLPAEVISAIYENFIQADEQRKNEVQDKGVVYTPIHLVNFLIDEVMPLDEAGKFKDGSYKILDPACGSGVFLVAAFKRLLQWWAINNSSAGNIQYPDSITAQKILEDNIYGVDTKEMATLVSIFGLTTALIDKLSPKELWNNLRFKDLSENNIKESNFFEWASLAKQKGEKFDLVIGNPPFNYENGVKQEDVLRPEFLKIIDFKHKDIPNTNLALHFFEGAMTFAKKGCMIIPSNVLLYSKSEKANKYREELFSDFTVNKIYDFTHLRRTLFHRTADTPVLALIAKNKPSEKQPIQHIVVKRTLSTEKNNRFEIDDYDHHTIRWNWAIDETKQFIWKTNLLGGGRLFHLVYRLSLLPTLKDFIEIKKAENPEWIYSSGYKIGGKDTKKIPAPYLHLKNTIDTKKNYNLKKNEFSTVIEEKFEFEAPRSEKLYSEPILIISRILGKKNFLMQLFNYYQPFNISLVGIHAPISERKKLEEIYYNIGENSEFSPIYQIYMLLTSSQLLINKETIFIKEDLDLLPYTENQDYLKLSNTEKILQDDILNYYIHLGKAINKNKDGAIFHEQTTELQLNEYGQVFCDTLNEIYAKNNKSWQLGKVYNTSKYTITQFGFGKNKGLQTAYLEDLDIDIKNLIENEIANRGAFYKRIIRFYKHKDGFDCVYFIKPPARRYWFKSIALRDADDTYADLKQEGY